MFIHKGVCAVCFHACMRAGWERQAVPLTVYAVQLILNLAWTPLFFSMHKLDWATFDILGEESSSRQEMCILLTLLCWYPTCCLLLSRRPALGYWFLYGENVMHCCLLKLGNCSLARLQPVVADTSAPFDCHPLTPCLLAV